MQPRREARVWAGARGVRGASGSAWARGGGPSREQRHATRRASERRGRVPFCERGAQRALRAGDPGGFSLYVRTALPELEGDAGTVPSSPLFPSG
jgi:hypothetical protein